MDNWWPVLRYAPEVAQEFDSLDAFERQIDAATGEGRYEIIGVRRSLDDDSDVAL